METLLEKEGKLRLRTDGSLNGSLYLRATFHSALTRGCFQYLSYAVVPIVHGSTSSDTVKLPTWSVLFPHITFHFLPSLDSLLPPIFPTHARFLLIDTVLVPCICNGLRKFSCPGCLVGILIFSIKTKFA